MAKFEVGDKVKMVRLDSKHFLYTKGMKECLGEQGKIKIVDLNSKNVSVTFYKCFLSYWMPFEWLELVEKKETGWTGKVVCTESDYRMPILFTPGKVYDVVNGNLIGNVLDDHGVVTHGEWFFESPEDIDRRVLHYGFTELKDMARDHKCKKDKLWNGKMLCTSSYGVFYTKGKVYDVREGLMFDDSGTRYNMIGYGDGYSTPEEIIDSAHKDGIYEFIEFKGFAGK